MLLLIHSQPLAQSDNEKLEVFKLLSTTINTHVTYTKCCFVKRQRFFYNICIHHCVYRAGKGCGVRFCSIISHLVTDIIARGDYEDVTPCSLVRINEKLLSNITNSYRHNKPSRSLRNIYETFTRASIH
jgi:hypothetical protein